MSAPVTRFTPDLVEIADGLRFPEGPVAMADGTVLVVEMFGERVTRVHPDGRKETVAETPGGPNGLAIGPDGAGYLCNNGGAFSPVEIEGMVFPGGFDPERYTGGRIQRVDLHDGTVTDLYTECDGRPLRAPNDLVMDGHGGFYFTDHGIRDAGSRTADLSGIYWARADGSEIREVAYPTDSPNGIGLSPDLWTLYWAETHTNRVRQRRVTGPGELAPSVPLDPTELLAGLGGFQYLDSLAVDDEGWVCVATIADGGITAIAPDGSAIEHHATGDLMTTNICFGDEDLHTAFVTLSSTGKLASFRWPRVGLRLCHC